MVSDSPLLEIDPLHCSGCNLPLDPHHFLKCLTNSQIVEISFQAIERVLKNHKIQTPLNCWWSFLSPSSHFTKNIEIIQGAMGGIPKTLSKAIHSNLSAKEARKTEKLITWIIQTCSQECYLNWLHSLFHRLEIHSATDRVNRLSRLFLLKTEPRSPNGLKLRQAAEPDNPGLSNPLTENAD